MKVLLATGLYAPEIGGPATHTAILEREMSQFGIEIISVPFGSVRHYPKIIRHAMYVVALLKKVRGVDVIYALDPVSVGLPALFVAWVARKKFVLRVAGDYAWEQAAGRYGVTLFLDEFVKRMGEQPLPVRVLGAFQRFVAKRADRVVVPSEYLKRIVETWGVRSELFSVVYTAFAPMRVKEDKEEIRAMLGYAGSTIVSVGRLVPWKGFRTLIDVTYKLSRDYPDITCVIIGDGPEHSALVAHAKERGMETHVRFVDRQPKQALAVALSGADVFVLNTSYEGFSHQLLEVMALGVPIVTTPVGGNTELLTDEREGLLVPYDDTKELVRAITRLLQEKSLRESVTAAARERVKEFSTPRMVEGIRQVLESVVHSR